MSDPFLGEIRIFAGNYAPQNWAFCNGQLLSPAQNDALFSLLGTLYGGDGRNSFGLPDMRGRLPVHFGTGPALTPRPIGQRTGTETVTLTTDQVPSHNHSLLASNNSSTSTTLAGNVLAKGLTNDNFYINDGSTAVSLLADSVSSSGGGQAHPNIMPYLCLNFIISLVGYYPPRN